MASSSTSGRKEQAHDPFLVLEPPSKKIKSSLSVKQFDVFINCRGPDVQTTLAWQLYSSLKNAGISAYLDSQEIELGDYFPSATRNAIYSARVHIAILSPRYAESVWCLAELALMFQTKARIIPLFYHVQPSDFRHIINGVADAFRKHEKMGRYPIHDIQQWKECLQNVTGIKGYELNGYDDDLNKLFSDLVSTVVKEKRKRKIPLQAAKYGVGLGELVKDFYSHCQGNGMMRDKIIGIFGMGGSGKTTLAKCLFNLKHSEFSGSTVLFNVRESCVKGELTSLQSKLLYDLFGENYPSFTSIEDGIAVIRDNLERNSESMFLIVIDDADHPEQLDALVHIDVINPNSLVIVTTRDERLLIEVGVRVRYKMKEMNAEHSRELFCWHAFHRQSCKIGFQNLVDGFVEVCGGLPLALHVMGAHVFGSDVAYWKVKLEEAKARLDKDIKRTLKTSYDGLEEDEKQMFMDIACFFIGEDVSRAISIWKGSGWRVKHTLQALKDKCLVQEQLCFHREDRHTIYNYEPKFILRMHDHLRNLGREMADNEMNHPRRLWRPEDLIGMRKIKGFQDILMGSERKSFKCYSRIEDHEGMAYYVENSLESTDLRWLELRPNSTGIPEWIPLQNLHTLKLDRVSPARLWQRNDQVPFKLKELCCCFDGVCIPGSIQDTWMWMRDLNELVKLLGMFKDLEMLQLNFNRYISTWNIEWNRLLKSVRELTNLKILELMYFQLEGEFTLTNSGKTIDDGFCMESLEAITLCGAFKTRRVSISGQLCPTLKSLKLDSMEDLIEVDVGGVSKLECLVMLKCGKLRKVLGNDLLELKMFRMKLCPTMRRLPNFGCVGRLKRIHISRCQNLQDISAIERLKGLKRIWIAHCPELNNLKAIEQLKGLKRIWIQKCTKLQGEVCFKELKELKRIFIGGCTGLQSIKGIEFLMCLESIVITACGKLQSIRGIEELNGLKEMIIADSPIISYVERLQRLPWELTITLGRSVMLDLISEEDDFKGTSAMSHSFEEKIGDILSMADYLYLIDCDRDGPSGWTQVEEQLKKIVHTTQFWLSTFIFCAMVDGFSGIASGFCDGSRILHDMHLGPKPGYSSRARAGRERKMYTCVVNEERLTNYDSWMPSSHMWSDCSVQEAFFMGVKTGEERKTLHILQSLVTRLRVGNSEDAWNADHDDLADEDEESDGGGADFADEDEESDGGDDVFADEFDADFAGEHDDGDEESDGGDDDFGVNFQLVASASPFLQREEERDLFSVPEPPKEKIKSSLTTEQFDVFINYRLSDIQKSLAGQLDYKLKQAGIHAFLDSQELEFGNTFDLTIKNAILSAKVHIAILSPRYAESASCLRKLALMFQTKATIIPLFYHVEPSDFRYIKNKVADAFSKHEKKGKYPIQQWKERLQNVSGITDYELKEQNDNADLLCKRIVSAVKKEVENRKVGLDELVEDFKRHYQQKRGLNDNIIGIYGMGGSGKTTLAKDLFNRMRSNYVRSCALFGVREASAEGDLSSLQIKLLNDLFYQNLRKCSSTEEGIRYIKRCLERSYIPSFLVVIDDVDQKTQIDALLSIDTLNSNCLVIITTRDERLLMEAGIRVRYKVKAMDQQHSRQLFCWHAFNKPDHEREYEDLVECFVKECDGLPLSLQVLGGHVLGRSKEEWKSVLDAVKECLDSEIKSRLQISYDSLEVEIKEIFMDIACFFTEKGQSIPIRIWNASGWKVEHALQILTDKCLVEVIKQDCWNEIIEEESTAFVFRMHNHLRQLGREMAVGENCRVQRNLDLPSKSFRNILAECHRCFNSISDDSISDKSITYFIGNSETSNTLQWLELNGSESIPSWISLQELEGLRIRGRLPRRLWDQTQEPPLKLKELVCKFTNCGWMEKAMLRRNWNEISNSLGMLSRLESLVLHLESQESRKDIVIEWNTFVESIRKLNFLKTLGLSGLYINGEIALGSSSEPTDSMLSLEAITLSHVGRTSKISISGPYLKSLKLKHMEDLIEVNLSEVGNLECLELIQCDRLTQVLADALPKLEILSIERCWEIQMLPNFSYSLWLRRIKISCCEELQNIIGIGELGLVESITITCCPKLHNIIGLEYLKGLKYMILSDGGMLSCVSELQELPSEFTITMGKAATSFPKAAEIAGITGALNEFQEYSSECTAVTGREDTCFQEYSSVSTAVPGRAATSFPQADRMTVASNEVEGCSSESTVVTGRAATSFPRADKMTDIASSSPVSEELSESTFVSRAPTSFAEADEDEMTVIGDTLIESHSSIADALIEFHSSEEAHTRLQLLLEKTQPSLSAIILCAMVDGDDSGSKYMVEGRSSQTTDLSWAGGKWIYTLLVTNPKQKYSAKKISWLPTSCVIENGYILPVNQGQESETLRILKRLTERLYRTDTLE